MKANIRTLLNGDRVVVVDAKRHRTLTLSCEAISKGVKNDPARCAIANQSKMDTGLYTQVHRDVAYVQVGKAKALRYNVGERERSVQMLNDLSLEASQKLAGLVVRLRAPTQCRTLAFHRSKKRKLRDALANSRSKARRKAGLPMRNYSRTPAMVLNLREKA